MFLKKKSYKHDNQQGHFVIITEICNITPDVTTEMLQCVNATMSEYLV